MRSTGKINAIRRWWFHWASLVSSKGGSRPPYVLKVGAAVLALINIVLVVLLWYWWQWCSLLVVVLRGGPLVVWASEGPYCSVLCLKVELQVQAKVYSLPL
jgi:hypothetical protein